MCYNGKRKCDRPARLRRQHPSSLNIETWSNLAQHLIVHFANVFNRKIAFLCANELWRVYHIVRILKCSIWLECIFAFSDFNAEQNNKCMPLKPKTIRQNVRAKRVTTDTNNVQWSSLHETKTREREKNTHQQRKHIGNTTKSVVIQWKYKIACTFDRIIYDYSAYGRKNVKCTKESTTKRKSEPIRRGKEKKKYTSQ